MVQLTTKDQQISTVILISTNDSYNNYQLRK